MSTNHTNNRTNWVDYGKGIGIFLMVYAHLLSSAYHGGIPIPEQFFKLSDSIIYSFHMPLFFFLSGLFVEESLRKRGTKEYVIDKFLRIAYPYIVWSILQVSVEIIFSDQTQKGATVENLLAIPYRPWGQFWFLYVLLLMHILYTILNIFGKYTHLLLFIISIYLYFYPIQIGFMSIANVSMFFIFFASGILFKTFFMNIEKINQTPWLGLALVIMLFISTLYAFTNLIEPTRLADRSHIYYFLAFSILGIFAFSALSQYLAHKNIFSFFQILGRYSLQIYLVHMLAGVGIRMVLLRGFGIENWMIHIISGVAFALIIPIVMQIMSDRFNFPYLFQIPRKNTKTLHP